MSNVTITDGNLVRRMGGQVLVGKAFAFVKAEAFLQPSLSWIRRALGGSAKPQVISMLSSERVELPGAAISPVALPRLSLANVTADKALYREGRDVVHLLALDPLTPGAEAVLEVRANGREFTRRLVRFNARGAAMAELRDLPGGDYEVRVKGATGPGCSFTVAEYKLAPLVASLVDRRMDGEKLAMTLRLESFGVPIQGEVLAELADRGRRIASMRAEAKAGLVEVAFKLTGDGPHAVNVQLSADPSKTATMPIVGSRAAERSSTPFSMLGTLVNGSLLPSEGAAAVRGIWLEQAGAKNSPLVLERVDTRRAKLTAMAPCDALHVVILDPTFPMARPGAPNEKSEPHPATRDPRYRAGEALFKEQKLRLARETFEEGRAAQSVPHPNYAYYIACCCALDKDRAGAVAALRLAIEDGWSDIRYLAQDADLASLRGYAPFDALQSAGYREAVFDHLDKGATIEVDVPGPMALVALGCFVGEAAWEGWAGVVSPDGIEPKVHVPATCAPGDRVTIEVETGTEEAAVWLVVKDARLLAPDTPSSRLAGQMKSLVHAAGERMHTGRVTMLLTEITPPPPETAVWAMPVPMRAAAPAGVATEGTRFAAPKAAPPATGMEEAGGPGAMKIPETAVDDPEVLFAGLVEAPKGVARATVMLGPAFADYLVEAFVLAGLDWSWREARFRAEKSPFVALDLPAFVDADDGAIGRVTAGGSPGAAVRVTRDGREVLTAKLKSAREEMKFPAGPGEFVAVIEDGGRHDRTERRVELPGRIRHVAKSLRLLESGQRFTKDSSTILLRVLPGLDRPFKALVDATADYGHACCEQTAAKLMAGCAMFAMAEDAKNRAAAEAVILAGVKREESMWLRGRGFKMYPESAPEPHAYYGPKAARHLQNLAMMKDLQPGRTLARAIERGLEMADDGCAAYKIAWPPRSAASCEEAYAVLRYGTDENARDHARSLVRDRAGDRAPEPPPSPWCTGAVAMRIEAAYAAAALFRSGERARALALANLVVKDFGPQGRLYSTMDSVAAIALMSELSAAGVVGGAATLEVDGRRMSSTEAQALSSCESVTVVEGVAPVEVVRIVEEDWTAFAATAAVTVALEKDGRAAAAFRAGDSLDLHVTLETGYKAGDLLWVCLPDALSRVIGGGQVKRFSVDFEGHSELIISLAATAPTVNRMGQPGPQRFAVCVRNMFEEERAGNPGLQSVMVKG